MSKNKQTATVTDTDETTFFKATPPAVAKRRVKHGAMVAKSNQEMLNMPAAPAQSIPTDDPDYLEWKALKEKQRADAKAKEDQARAHSEKLYTAGESFRTQLVAMTNALDSIVNAGPAATGLGPMEVYSALQANKVHGFVWLAEREYTDAEGNEIVEFYEVTEHAKGVQANLKVTIAAPTGDKTEYVPISALLTSLFHCGRIVKTGNGARGENAVRYWKVNR